MNKLTVLLSISHSVAATERVLRGSRALKGTYEVNGECTVANFASAAGGESKLSSILGVGQGELQNTLDTRCDAAAKEKDFSDTTGKGPQFLKNFLDGGTTWNDNEETDSGEYVLSEDAAMIQTEYAAYTSKGIYSKPDGGTEAVYPGYFSNFFSGDKECTLGVIECCYTSSRKDDFVGNAEMCALDLKTARKSNHIQDSAFTIYDGNDESDIYCSGFAYDAGSFGDDAKYNTLFHMAMKTNLYDKGYVKNVPGAPLCGCIEQMPIIDNADCVEAVEGYILDDNGTVTLNITWRDCGDLKKHIKSSLDKSEIEMYFIDEKIVEKGTCEAAAKSFLNDRMYVPKSD